MGGCWGSCVDGEVGTTRFGLTSMLLGGLIWDPWESGREGFFGRRVSRGFILRWLSGEVVTVLAYTASTLGRGLDLSLPERMARRT